MRDRIPMVMSIDVEPDERQVDPAARKRWAGFEVLVARIRHLRPKLAQAMNAPVHFCWTVRLDPQVEHVYGRPDWPLVTYRREFEELRAQGDAVGVHTHAWRWDEDEKGWIVDHGNPGWIDQCVNRSLDTFRRVIGERAR